MGTPHLNKKSEKKRVRKNIRKNVGKPRSDWREKEIMRGKKKRRGAKDERSEQNRTA